MFVWKWCAGLVLFLVAAGAAGAQESALGSLQSSVPDMHQSFTANLGPEVDNASKTKSLPDAATGKNAGSGGQQSGRFQLSEGADAIRFRSPLFTANTVGIKTSGSYALNDHLGVECAVAATFGHEIYAQEHVKLLTVGCGPRVEQGTGRIEPWIHALGGWGHVQPQTAGNSRSGLSIAAGGGVDYWIGKDVALRTEADYLGTNFFKSSQNNVQVSVGVVIRFGNR